MRLFGNKKAKPMQSIHQSGKRSRSGQTKSLKANNTRPELAQERWRQRYEHYRGLAESARDVDRSTRENYWQHAEHYFRMITEQRIATVCQRPRSGD